MWVGAGLRLGYACTVVLIGWAITSPASGAIATIPLERPGQLDEESLHGRRLAMVAEQIEARGIGNSRVLEAMRKVPRHRFVPGDLVDSAYADTPLPIGYGQTISQPYIVAYMSEALRVAPQHRVLEIGTGSAYQAAVLGELAKEVYTIEIVPELARQARRTLEVLGYRNVYAREGDGYLGWPEAAPFDRIIVTAAPEHVPQPLVDQLAVGGRLVIPVGTLSQRITIIDKNEKGTVRQETIGVRFVPLVRKPG
jgi:protein-L-isoaspartate(D-aspartate) O-methyltransferase